MIQEDLAAALDVSPSVISALVNNVTGKSAAGRKLKKKALEYLLARVRSSESVNKGRPETDRMYGFHEGSGEPGKIPTKNDCREHLEKFLESCADDSGKIAWTSIELKEHFPLNKWNKPKP